MSGRLIVSLLYSSIRNVSVGAMIKPLLPLFKIDLIFITRSKVSLIYVLFMRYLFDQGKPDSN